MQISLHPRRWVMVGQASACGRPPLWSRPRPSLRHAAAPARLQPRCKAGAEEGNLTPPLQVTTIKTLTGEERMPAPLWSTFCGVSNGLWVGTAAAYNPYTGKAEPVSLEGRTKVYQQGSVVVEERIVEGGRDRVLRRRAYTDSEAAFHEALRQASCRAWSDSDTDSEAGSSGGSSTDVRGDKASAASSTSSGGSSDAGGGAVLWAEEEVEREQEGLFIFEGGSYSAGPVSIGCDSGLAALLERQAAEAAAAEEEWLEGGEAEEGPLGFDDEEEEEEEWEGEHGGEGNGSGGEEEGVWEEGGELGDDDEEEDPPADLEGSTSNRVASVSEWVLQWGSGHRVRLALTLSTAGGVDGTELDVEVLRVALARERWEGLPGTYAPSASQQEGMSLAAQPGPRLRAKQLTGEWKVFATECVTVEDVSMETGLPTLLPVYTTRETQQRVTRAGGDGGSGSGARGKSKGGRRGGGSSRGKEKGFGGAAAEVAEEEDEAEEAVEGAVLWLPHQVALSLRMMPPEAAAGEGGSGSASGGAGQRQDEEQGHGYELNGNGNGNGNGSNGGGYMLPPPRQLPGLQVGVSWVPANGTVVSLTRQYSCQGELQRVTCSTAIRAS